MLRFVDKADAQAPEEPTRRDANGVLSSSFRIIKPDGNWGGKCVVRGAVLTTRAITIVGAFAC